MNNFPSRETINKIRSEYPAGTRIKLIQMNDPYSKLTLGDKGTVDHVDDIGTIHVKWDSGSGLGLIYGEDRFEVDVNICGICGKPYEGYGNNPDPVVTKSGEPCCDECNVNVVVPMRIMAMKND